MDYTSTHSRNIITEDASGIYSIESGSIVRFNYKGKNVTNSRPIVLVLNPDWDGKLHGLALEPMSENMLNDLYKIVKETLGDKIEKITRLRFGRGKARITDPQQFYSSKLKPLMPTQSKESPYRTYLRSGVTNVRMIDYRFKDYVAK